MEPTLCSMYADLCHSINMGLDSFPKHEYDGEVITFKRILLNKCQQTFEGLRAQARQMTAPDQEELEQMHKQTMLLKVGNIRLIGDLLKHKMVAERIPHLILQVLSLSIVTLFVLLSSTRKIIYQ